MESVKGLSVMLLIVLCFNVKQTKQKSSGGSGGSNSLMIGLEAVSFGLEIFNTALNIKELLDEEDPQLTTEHLDSLRDEILISISDMLENIETDIILVIKLQHKVSRLTEIKVAMSSSLIDLERYLRSDSEDRKSHEDEFIKQFQKTTVQELRTLLTGTVPNLSTPMTSLIVNTTDCNMTSIMEFENFYGKLVSQGITLEYAYAKLKVLNIDYVYEYWNESLILVQKAYDIMENECIARFSESVVKEVKQNIVLGDLHKNSNERYNWKWNDVYQYEPRDTASHAWNYFVSLPDPNFLFWNGPTSSSNRILVFGDKNASIPFWEKATVQSQLEANVSTFQHDIDGQRTAKELGKVIGSFINDINFVYKCIIVLNGEANQSATVIIDEEYSPVAYVYVPSNGNSGYHVYVYPEIWNNFTAYTKLYNENELTVSCGPGIPNAYFSITVLCFTITVALLIK